MKIAYVCSDAEVQVLGHEGCSVHIREFTNALVDAGHDVFVVCAWAGDGDRGACKARIHTLEPTGADAVLWKQLEQEPLVQEHHLGRDLRSVLWSYWLQTRGAEIFEREAPDFVYERFSLFGWGAGELARRFGAPLIVEVNTPLSREQEGYPHFTLTRTAREMEGETLRRADGVVAVSGWIAKWARGLGVDPERIRVVPNAVSERLFAHEISGEGARRRLGLQGARVVGFVGSFHWWHDVRGLLEAFARLAPDDDGLRLLLVGGGERRKRLEARAAELGLGDRVVFTGKVPHDRVPEYFAAMDVAVVPYAQLDDFYFSPLKLFECMALGRPTVAASIGQIAELVEHDRTGWLYPPGDDVALARGIRALLDAPERAAAMGAAGRELVLARHTWSRVAADVAAWAGTLRTSPRSPGPES